jgi:hypothetical protein
MTHINKAGRNDACPCGSGKKFKKCCELKQQKSRSMLMLIIVGLLMAAGIATGISSFMSDRDVARPGGVWSAEHGHYH